MKKLMNLSKFAIAALVTSGLFVACSEEISENTVDTQYTAQTGNITNAGQAVDLGLPSGTLWADKNVGASNESDNGILFIWGDITGKVIDANNDATYTDVTEITSLDELFNMYSSYTATDGNLCDTTKIAQTSEPKLINTEGMSPRATKEAVLAYLKARLDYENQKSATGKGFLEATFVNDDLWTVLMNLKDGEYIERIPDLFNYYYSKLTKDEQDARKAEFPPSGVTPEDSLNYYSEYKPAKVSILSVDEIVINEIEYNVSGWVNNANDNYAKVIDLVGAEIRKDYTAGTIGSSIKDINEKKDGFTFVPAYYIYGDPNYDAATANWGNGWRMPTTAELAELRNYCTWTIEGNGYRVTGPNGNSIYLPAAGYRHGEKQYGNGNAGWYASGEIISTYAYPSMKSQSKGSKGDYSSKENMPSVLVFQSGQYNSVNVINNMSASYAFSIRPVRINLY